MFFVSVIHIYVGACLKSTAWRVQIAYTLKYIFIFIQSNTIYIEIKVPNAPHLIMYYIETL